MKESLSAQAEQLVWRVEELILNAERQIEQTENRISVVRGRNPGPVRTSRSLTERQPPTEVRAGLPFSLLDRRLS
jgi:outer membrane protein TolC